MDETFCLEIESACRPRRPKAGRPAMPFGMYKGIHLDQIPLDYLEWVITLDLKPYLRAQVLYQISRHGGARP